ncbi:MAG: methyltransferase domain-containing protein [Acidobacteria bacterium]|nr:methyltransferase domain-containing protein [Acidobacteriota bacterium]
MTEVRGRSSPYHEAEVAAVYDRLALPIQFAAPAADLVTVVAPAADARVLDVGAGTGAVTVPAKAAVGKCGVVIAIDPSPEMLGHLRAKGRHHVAVARVPHLPFSDDTFDVILASFVVSHFPDYRSAIAELARVLRCGGRIGLTAWETKPTAPARFWRQQAGEFVRLGDLDEGFRAVIPWDEFFADPQNFRRAFAEAGLTAIDVVSRQYQQSATVADFLTLRESAVEGRVLRRLVGKRWEEFRRHVREAFAREFGERVEYTRGVNIAVATKPV